MTAFLLGVGRATTIARRVLSISAYSVGFLLLLCGLPLWLLVAGAVDFVRDLRRKPTGGRRWRFVAVRTVLFLLLYFSCELAGILITGAIWLAFVGRIDSQRDRYLSANFALQSWWGHTLGTHGLRLFDARLEVEGVEAASPGPEQRPILLFIRHASMVDTMLALLLLSRPYGYRLRYVLKRPLLWDPCLDIAGNRLPNQFVTKGTANSKREIEKVGRLADGLGPLDGVLIYPEGTRFTVEKREQAIRSLKRRGSTDDAERAQRLEHVLLPRRGGPFALLRTNARSESPADVLFCVHQGFEGSATFRDLWHGELLGKTIRVRFWRVPFEAVPQEPEAQVEWLFDEWEEAEAFVREHAAIHRGSTTESCTAPTSRESP